MDWASFWAGAAALPALVITALIVVGGFYLSGKLLGVLAREWKFRKIGKQQIKTRFAATLAVMDWWIISPHKSVALIIAPLRRQTPGQRTLINKTKLGIDEVSGNAHQLVPDFKTGDEPEFRRLEDD